MMPKAETATVYRASNGRRYFTKRGACNVTAKRAVLDAYPCDCEDADWVNGISPSLCAYHSGDLARLIERYARLLKRRLTR